MFYNEDYNSSDKFADVMENTHPKCTMKLHGSEGNFDYIYYTPSCMRVSHLLEMPSDADISEEVDLPSTKFPSDHLRI